MTSLTPIGDLTVAELLTRWPQTARVFHRHNMACVGCAVASFYTVADAATVYDLPLDPFLGELQQAMDNGSGAGYVSDPEKH